MYQILLYTHLSSVLMAFPIGGWLLLNPKGTKSHRLLGKPYMALMFITGIASLLMPATLGPTLLGHFGFIHIFSLMVLYNVPMSIYAIRRGNVRAHKSNMVGLYVGGILIAGSFAFMPGRLMHQVLFG
ncbi:MAG: DUF2306 domain-containing protein [Pseudomonadales bacterium]|nr:DUF2306 domain-containing protein [Pseudomonadales bacterium]